MKNLLALVGLLVVGFAGAGWYFGWYKFSEKTDSQGHIQLELDVNAKKIKQDAQKGEAALQNLQKQVGTSVQSLPPAPPPVQTNIGSGPPLLPPPTPPVIQWQVPEGVIPAPPAMPPGPPPLPGGPGL